MDDLIYKYKHKHFVSISNDIHFKTIGTQTIANEFKSRNVGNRFQSQKIKLDEIHMGWIDTFWKQITFENIWLG